MKRKITSLKPNECIHIRTEKDARKIAKLINNKGVYNNIPKSAKTPFYLELLCNLHYRDSDYKPSAQCYPATDFIKPKSKLKKRVKALEDAVFSKTTIAKTELNELPEKWCVRVTTDNCGALSEWLTYPIPEHGYVFNDKCFSSKIKLKYTEISFADFKRLVLGEIKTLETNKWYALIENPKCIGCYQNTIDANYGFDEQGNWCTAIAMNNPECWRLLSEEEVKAALIAEAEKRGFKDGVKFTALYSCGSSYGMDSSWGVDYHIDLKTDENSLSIIKNDYDWLRLMANGKWATIIEQTKEIDWSVAGQYVKSKQNGFIGITTGLEHGKNASVFYIHPKMALKGDTSTVYKGNFELLSEPITINPV